MAPLDLRIERDGTGAFHRRHELDATAPGIVRAAIEDDMHHFELVLHHDGRAVTGVDGRAVRWPWATCADASTALAAITGITLSTSPTAVGAWTGASEQCTHLFDLAGLAVAHAARHVQGGAARRSYLATVPDWSTPPFEGRLERDGTEILRWTLDDVDGAGTAIVAPTAAPFAGVALRGRFIRWCEDHLDDDTAEAAFVLRRAVWMSPARHLDLERYPSVADTMVGAAVCYATQPQRVALGRRNRGSLRDYGRSPGGLLREFAGDHAERSRS